MFELSGKALGGERIIAVVIPMLPRMATTPAPIATKVIGSTIVNKRDEFEGNLLIDRRN